MNELSLPVSLRIRGPLARVFAAWTDTATARNWHCDRIDGEYKSGATVTWNFGDFRQALRIDEVRANELIVFHWQAHNTDPETEVRIQFTDLKHETGIKIVESSWPLSKESVAKIVDHACGWENMLCRLKVWIELGARFSNDAFTIENS